MLRTRNLHIFKILRHCVKKMSIEASVGIVVIGDEILKGKIQDTNSHFLCQNFYQLGLEVSQVSIIPDKVEAISESVRKLSQICTYVVTTGGVGPTHDDVTYEGVAKAFDENLLEAPELSKIFKQWCQEFGFSDASAHKMALVPQSSQIHIAQNLFEHIRIFPVVSVRNVYIFPGIPKYLQKSFNSLKHLFTNEASQFRYRSLYLDASEFDIAIPLSEVADHFRGKIQFGSYPVTEIKPYQVEISIDVKSDDTEILADAEAYLRSSLPPNVIVPSVDPKSEISINKVFNLANVTNDVGRFVKSSLDVIEKCFDTYTSDSVCLSFNGGKDCTALLHLVYSVFRRTSNSRLKTVYIRTKDPFPELEDFVWKTVHRYDLDLYTFEGPIKTALHKFNSKHPEIKSIFLGTRGTDPSSGGLATFQICDEGWPKFMRVSPLLDWDYHTVWTFLRELDVAYCSLYDIGYTSLGNKNNTDKNVQLKMENCGRYRPAYLLKDSNQERDGRSK